MRIICNLVNLGARAGVVLIIHHRNRRVHHCFRLNANGCGPGATEICASLKLLDTSPSLNTSVSRLFGCLANCSHRSDCQRLLITPLKLQRRLVSLVRTRVSRIHRKQSNHVVTGVGSLISPALVALLCRTSRTKMSVSLVIQNVYYLQPKISNLDRGVHIVDIVKRLLRRSHVFCFCDNNRRLFLLNDTS